MASGQPYLSTDADRWLYGVLSVDPLLQQYAPGGFWAEHPPERTIMPCVRWWKQAPGKDLKRQDGMLGRVESEPAYVVCMLDKQPGGSLDKVYGTYGAAQSPQEPYFEAGARRIATLLDGRLQTANGFQFFSYVLSEFNQSDPQPQGAYDVMLGSWVQLSVQ
jgi:hypothetical protein